MERNFTNLAENQSATKMKNQRRTSCLGRNAYAMLFALMLFVGMGTAWGQSSSDCIKVESNGTTKYFTTFAGIYDNTNGIFCNTTANSFGNRDAAVTITFLKDYEMTAADVVWTFTNHRNGTLTIDGGGYTISAASGLSSSMFKWNYDTDSYFFKLLNITINGGIGKVIEKSGTSHLYVGEAGSPVTINGGSTTSNLIDIAGGATTITNTTIYGQTATGTLINDTGVAAMTITDSEINGSTVANTGHLINKSVSAASGNTMAFTNTTFNGNAVTGDLISVSSTTIQES